MRLIPTEQQVIRDASLRYFGVRPRLYGAQSMGLQLIDWLTRLQNEFERRKSK